MHAYHMVSLRSETTPYINLGKGDTLAQRAVSLLHQGKGRNSEDLEGDNLCH